MCNRKTIEKWDLVTPTEDNDHCVFGHELEDNPLVYFHLTRKSNLDSIISKGFLSAAELGVGVLSSISYSKQSSGCFANKGNIIHEDLIVFAVKFNTLHLDGIEKNCSDIHVRDKDIQPVILGYCELPKGYPIQ